MSYISPAWRMHHCVFEISPVILAGDGTLKMNKSAWRVQLNSLFLSLSLSLCVCESAEL